MLNRYLVFLSVLFIQSALAADGAASYIESRGKIVELVSTAISPIDDGENPPILTAIEADELIEPSNADQLASTARLIGWRRIGDTIIIYRHGGDTEAFPASAIQVRFVKRATSAGSDSATVPPPS